MDNLTDKILGIASDFGCDIEGFRPHLEQIIRELETKNPPSRNKVGAASNSIADKELREAIEDILDNKIVVINEEYGGKEANQIMLERSLRTGIAKELLALFHAYGNRERIDELATLTPTLVMETECEECVKNEDTISNRIEELNREVES